MAAAEISVVIVNYRKGELLHDCIESVFATAKDLPVEVIVVDNASNDGTTETMPQDLPRLRLIGNRDNVGFARATNQGMATARGEFLLWLNPDTVVREGALAELRGFLRGHPDAGAVGPKMVGPDGSTQYSCRAFPSFAAALFARYSLATRLWPTNPFSRRYLLSDWNHDAVRKVDWISGACLMTSREVIRQVGGLDEGFFLFNEDVDWCRRLKAAGWNVYYQPRAVVVHHIGASRGALRARVVIERHRGMFRYYRKHMRRTPLLDLPVAVGLALRAGLELLTKSSWRARS
jgi:N-acetylglucosaminyl-diphospho-decaprenol L-rhamnosyltransferase